MQANEVSGPASSQQLSETFCLQNWMPAPKALLQKQLFPHQMTRSTRKKSRRGLPRQKLRPPRPQKNTRPLLGQEYRFEEMPLRDFRRQLSGQLMGDPNLTPIYLYPQRQVLIKMGNIIHWFVAWIKN